MIPLILALTVSLAQSAPAGSAAATSPAPQPAPATSSSTLSPDPAPVASPSNSSASAPTTKVVSGPITLAVSTQKKILVVRVGGVDVKQYTVAVGTKAKPTPTGQFTIHHIVWNPAWHPPAEKWAKGKKPAAPRDPKNPMKVVKVFFQEPDYYIHGTDQEDSLGSAASHGCIRMNQDDVYSLARYLQDHAGAAKSDAWYAAAISGATPESVQLPKGVPIVIGK